MTKLSSSPERNTFHINNALKKMEDETDVDALNELQATIEMYQQFKTNNSILESAPNWAINNMEYDLRTTDWILEKVRKDDTYAQHLYAAMCNNEFIKNDVFPILKEEKWSCSWRYAGGIIADMQETGDYINWYCSGIQDSESGEPSLYVSESVVTDEIRQDLLNLGWIVIQEDK